MALLTAYAKLQLDPDDHSRMAAFEALCWHHIFKHGPRDWIIGCRNGFIKLQLWTSKTSNTQGFKSFDSTLNKIVFNFVHAYAAVIWPTDDTKRSHLALVDDKYHGTELKALQWQLGVSQGIKRRFKEIQDLDLTAEDAMVESKIGQRVRVYLMSLLLSKQSIPEKQPTAAGELLQMFLNPPTRKRTHSKRASATTTGTLPLPGLQDSLKRSKKERTSSQEKPSQLQHRNATCERSTGLVRLRLTFSGAKRLHSILLRPSQPAADLMESSDALSKTANLVSTFSGTKNIERNTATKAYQCWFRNCGEVFHTTQEVVLHVKQKHMIEYRELTNVPTVPVAVMYSTSQHLPTVPDSTRQVNYTDIQSPEAREAPEQDSAIGANVLLQSLQDAENAGFTFDDEYVAMIHRYARG
jgi:hypothetical protein